MSGRHLWRDIRRAGKCPHCGHWANKHTYVKDISDLLDTDIWTCSGCEANGKTCTIGGPVDAAPKKVKKKGKDPFGGKL